ncbi:hypothetical protein [Clostridium sp.]|uniref:hypothetical protein n=1 Tax=Clostridium sp. TaxID=1506 RepID=UPI0025B840C1|nr:hypothetical protein [Clostridium sp.]
MRITDMKGVAPTNYKKGMLIQNKYRTIDIIIMIAALGWGFSWLMLLLFLFVPNILAFIILVILIPVIAIGLVQPIENYHNNLEYVLLLIKYRMKDKNFTNIVIKEKKKTIKR